MKLCRSRKFLRFFFFVIFWWCLFLVRVDLRVFFVIEERFIFLSGGNILYKVFLYLGFIFYNKSRYLNKNKGFEIILLYVVEIKKNLNFICLFFLILIGLLLFYVLWRCWVFVKVSFFLYKWYIYVNVIWVFILKWREK